VASNKHTKEERQFHLAEVSRLYLMGWPKHLIAKERKVAPSQITYDLKALQRAWVASAMIDFNAVRGQQLERLDMMEEQLWTAWHESREDTTETYSERTELPPLASQQNQQTPIPAAIAQAFNQPPQQPASTRVQTRAGMRQRQRHGNPDYMSLILNICQERSKLCGLYPKDTSEAQQLGSGVSMAFLQYVVKMHEEGESSNGATEYTITDVTDTSRVLDS
jgi:FtsZ-interacting cell division protein YlmF